MRIVIDLQGAQTASRQRGIGRYTLSLTLALARNIGNHELILALNGGLPEEIDSIYKEFSTLLPRENIHVWYGPIPTPGTAASNYYLQAAKIIRETFLASLKPDVILVPSLFEGFDNAAITSIGLIDFEIPVVVSFHDLIPLLNPVQYLDPYPVYAQYYLEQVEYLRRADLLLAGSLSAAKELEMIGIDCTRNIVCVPHAADHIFHPREDSVDTRATCAALGITGPFIFYSGGIDPRKNVKRLVEAFLLLPTTLQERYQLVIAGKILASNQRELLQILEANPGVQKKLIFTDYISDDTLATLYARCTVFVQPSIHEGFGLPALEAMACGAAVIGSNLTSIPEVIGRDDALFDPYQPKVISQKLEQVLTDEDFRNNLAAYGLEQAKNFTWDLSASRVLKALQEVCIQFKEKERLPAIQAPKKIALVSPVPPERTGVAEYTAQLLPELSRYFEVNLILDQNEFDVALLHELSVNVHDTKWLIEHAHEMDYVIYQFGNSQFHGHMFSLLEVVPGIVVLHDFFLSDLLFHYEFSYIYPHIWTKELYYSHGYLAIQERFTTEYPEMLKAKFPVNLRLLEQAQGVIVHSQVAIEKAKEWFGKDFISDWQLVPLVRSKKSAIGRVRSRQLLGLQAEDYVVCSFGFLDVTKSNLSLLLSWLTSSLSKDPRCKLIFVGENQGGDYGQQMLQTIANSERAAQIRITGWVDEKIYQAYLEAADCAVQLRSESRGETSAAVLDCLMWGLPTIVNAHGSMAELPAQVVNMLPEYFTSADLIAGLELLWEDQSFAQKLAVAATCYIQEYHSPEYCGNQYRLALDVIHQCHKANAFSAIEALAELGAPPTREDALQLSQFLLQSFPQPRPTRQLLIDITGTHEHDLRTGIERVSRALIKAFINNPPEGFRVEPVYLSQEKGNWQYRYARKYVLEALACPKDILSDDVVEVGAGDILLGVDISGYKLIEAENCGLLQSYRHQGVKTHFVVYDLLPILLPHRFPEGSDRTFQLWLEAVLKNHGILCDSQAVTHDLKTWLRTKGAPRFEGQIGWFYHGADFENSFSSSGISDQEHIFLQDLNGQLNFLVVGTIEPRKAHIQVIEAFTQLWQQGFEANLIIVGREGWKNLPKKLRRTIPRTIAAIKKHPLINQRLFWLSDASDDYLARLYQASQCLIMASEGEGFGLPLVEAARYGTSVLARDLPVFREVLGQSATYFSGATGNNLANAITQWSVLYENGTHPTPKNLQQQSWEDSARQILDQVIPNSKSTS